VDDLESCGGNEKGKLEVRKGRKKEWETGGWRNKG
jgi:hypothetical protein